MAELKGTSEVPPNGSTATGFATVVVDPSNTLIVYRVTHSLAAPTGAHLHLGIATEVGPVSIAFPSAASPITGTATTTVAQANAIRSGRMYVNVHTSAFAGGEIRGPLLRVGERALTATMTGAQVVPPVTTQAYGGLQYMLNVDAGVLRCAGFYAGMVLTSATLYAGDGGVNGSALAPIDPMAMSDGGFLFMDDNIVQPPLIDLMLSGRTYGIVRSSAFPMGEIRGQVQPLP